MNDDEVKQILIVKTSSLGDIIQAFDVLNYLHYKLPRASIDWVVEERFVSIVAAHPLVNRAIAFDIKKIKRHWKEKKNWAALGFSIRSMRQTRYDLLFDLQGNCKSGVVTFLCRADLKIGFGRKSVREWPNLLATQQRFDVLRTINIRQQYVSLIQKFFDDPITPKSQGVKFKIDENAQQYLQTLLSSSLVQKKTRVMVCPGSKWINKQMPLSTLESFLLQIEGAVHCSFLLIWGTEDERKNCLLLHQRLSESSIVVDRLELPLWQNLISAVDLVIAVDSSALHLCATTSTPSFSIFGPTSPDVFKPLGFHHCAFQGNCPYQRSFEKQCPLLRTCSTGACIRDIHPNQLFERFWSWWTAYNAQIV